MMFPPARISNATHAVALVIITTCFAPSIGVFGAEKLKPGYTRPIGGVVLSSGNSDLKVGPGMDASNRSLDGCEFNWTDLTGANFEGSDLSGLKIENCNLKDASFRGASLKGFLFYSGDIDGADFTDATISDNRIQVTPLWNLSLSREQFMSTASYKNKNLANCTIPGQSSHPLAKELRYDFQDADLTGSLFGPGDFSACDFTNARLGHTMFRHTILEFDTLSQARPFKVSSAGEFRLWHLEMSSARILGDCDFSGMRLTGVSFSARYSDSVELTDATLNDCYLLYIDTKHLTSTKNHQQGDLAGLRFEKCDFAGCDFSGRDLADSTFRDCDFTQAKFTDAVISRVQFADPPSEGVTTDHASRGLTTDQIRSTWNYKHGRMKGIVLPVAVQAVLDAE